MNKQQELISFIIPCYASEGSVGLVIDELREIVRQKPAFDYQITLTRRSSRSTWPRTAAVITR